MNVSLDLVDVIASIVISLLGTGWLGNHLLAKSQHQHEVGLETLRSSLEVGLRGLQTELDRTVTVHRLHFEVEFRSLRRIWSRVASVRSSMSSLRPSITTAPLGQTDDQREERYRERLQAFSEDHYKLVRALHSCAPFIPEDIYRKTETALSLSRRELTDNQIRHEDRFGLGWFNRGEQNFNSLAEAVDELSSLIRNRLESLVVAGAEK